MKSSLYNKILIAIGILAPVLMLSSCFNNEDEEAAEQAKIAEYVKNNGFSEADKLPSGIYIKFHNERTFDENKSPKHGQTVIINYTARTTDGEVLETTDEVLGKREFPNLYFVFGPFRTKKGDTKIGIDTALYYFNPGDSATIILPSGWANFDYVPLVVNLGLDAIIQNDTVNADSLYEVNQLIDFLATNDFKNTIFNPDTFSPGLYWKSATGELNPDPFPFDENDVAKIILTARYAETYYNDGLGRVFYPLANAPVEINRIFEGVYSFPYIPAIDTALRHMNVGDKLEIAAISNYAYYSTGFKAPMLIVPPYMPVHYEIELLDAVANQ